MKQIKLIVCVSKNGVIGNNGDLVFNIKKDMDYFRSVTTGNTVVMGRKTWESIPSKYRPLKGRLNLILSKEVHQPEHPDVQYHQDLKTVLGLVEEGKIKGDLWVMGGSSIYEAFLPYADELHITVVNEIVEGDTKFVNNEVINPKFELISTSEYHKDPETGKEFTFNILKRI